MKKQFMKWVLCLSIMALPLLSIESLAADRGGHGGGSFQSGGNRGGGSWDRGGSNLNRGGNWNRGNNWNGNWHHNRDYGNYWGPGWGTYYYGGYPSVSIDVDSGIDSGYVYPQYDSGSTYYYSE